MPIVIKSDAEIALMREAGVVVAEVLELLASQVRPGLRVRDLDTLVEDEFRQRQVIPTFLGYLGYPARVCVSINEQIVHGIPGDRLLNDGDLVSIDLGATHEGFVADTALTVGCGTISEDGQRLIDATYGALRAGIDAAQPGARLGEVSHAIQEHAESFGYSVVRKYVGHGVGRQMHEEPQVPNYGSPDRGVILRKGMVLALEPMVNIGGYETREHDDGWTVSTADGSLSAHFEHTVAITEHGPEILTLRSEEVPAGRAAAVGAGQGS
jgi:methionyl aminopeptidase